MCFQFGLLILYFWLFGRSCAFVLAFWAFLFFHFCILGFHFLSFCFSSFPLILVFWAFMCFYHGVLAIPLAIRLDTLLDTHECQKCTPSLDAHAKLSLHDHYMAMSWHFHAFSCICVDGRGSLFEEEFPQYVLKRTVSRIAVNAHMLELESSIDVRMQGLVYGCIWETLTYITSTH